MIDDMWDSNEPNQSSCQKDVKKSLNQSSKDVEDITTWQVLPTTNQSSKKVEDITECPICSQTMTDPKILPCIHTFCLGCLQLYGQERNTKGELNCPVCRATFTVDNGDYSRLKNNFFVEKLITAKRSSEELQSVTKCCEVCSKLDEKDRKITAEMYCMDCQEYLCDQCTKIHKTMKMSRAHRLRSTNDLQSLKECLQSTISFCDEHPNKEIEIYCLECTTICCMMCYIQNHQSHKCSDVNKFAEEFKTRMKHDLDELAKLTGENKKQISEVMSIKRDYEKKFDRSKAEILQKCEKIKLLVDEHMHDLLNSLQNIQEKQVITYKTAEEDMQIQVNAMESFERYALEMFDKALPSDIARVAEDISMRAKILRKSKVLKIEKQASVSINPGDLDTTTRKGHWNIVGKLSNSPSKMTFLSVSSLKNPVVLKELQLERKVVGVTVLQKQLFVLMSDSEIVVYKSDAIESNRTLAVHGVDDSHDLASHEGSLYLSVYFTDEHRYCTQEYNTRCGSRKKSPDAHVIYLEKITGFCNAVVRIRLLDMRATSWTIDDIPEGKNKFDSQLFKHLKYSNSQRNRVNKAGLSITKIGNVLVCHAKESLIKEYTTNGNLVRNIPVSFTSVRKSNMEGEFGRTWEHRYDTSQEFVNGIFRAFQLSTDVVLLHNEARNFVCQINTRNGEVTKSYKGKLKAVFVDQNGGILVNDMEKNRLSILNSSLDFINEVIPHLSNGINKIFSDKVGGILYLHDEECRCITILQYPELGY